MMQLVLTIQEDLPMAKRLVKDDPSLLAAAVPKCHGESVLHYFVVEQSEAAVMALLQFGASPNSQNEFGYSPLADAIRLEHTAIMRLLLEYGADPNTVLTGPFDTALLVAVCTTQPNADVIRLLVKHGADMDYRGFCMGSPREILEQSQPDLLRSVLSG